MPNQAAGVERAQLVAIRRRTMVSAPVCHWRRTSGDTHAAILAASAEAAALHSVDRNAGEAVQLRVERFEVERLGEDVAHQGRVSRRESLGNVGAGRGE